MRIVTFDPNKCVACRNCEYACAYQHKQDFKRADAQIRVSFYPEERVCIPLTCIHCADAWCLNVCPAGAISRNPQTGAVEIDQKKCKGCKMCMLACPYGNIHFDEEKMVSSKCDLCGGDPSCVKFCHCGALQFEEAEDAFAYKRNSLDARLKQMVEKKRGVN